MPAPTATVSLDTTWVRKMGDPVNVAVTFSEAVTGFDKSDLSFEHGTFSDPVDYYGDGLMWTTTLTLNAGVDRTADTISVNLSGITSVSDSTPGAGSASSNLLSFDTKPATATITVADTALQPGETSLVTFKFSEFINDFDTNDVSASNGTLTDFTLLGDGMTWTAKLTTDGGAPNTPHFITLNNAGFHDDVNNVGSGTTTSNSYVIDTASPTVTSIAVAKTALKIGDTSLVTFTFSEAVQDFTVADLTVANGAVTGLAVTGDPKIWTGTFTPTASVEDATNLISLNMVGVTDLAGNAGTSTMDSGNYTIDTVRPTATSIVVADSDLRAGETSLVTITFSEAITGFTTADMSVANGTLSGLSTDDGGITWTATLTPDGDVSDTTNLITLANVGVADLAGNAGTGTSDSNNYAINTRLPIATIVVADNALQIGETSLVTITFSEAVTGFDNADLTVQGGTLTTVATLDGGITFTATFTPTGNIKDTSNAITLDNSGVTGGNVGAGTTTSNNYAIDTARPTVNIAVSDPSLAIGETATVTFTFSEAVSGFALADIDVANGVLSNLSTSDNITYTATLTPTASITDVTNVITLKDASVSDSAGNANSGTTDSGNYVVDTEAPTVVNINVAHTALMAGGTSDVTITFSEAVRGFANSDLSVPNGTLSAVSSSDGGVVWTATFTPTSGIRDTTNLISLNKGGLTDVAGNTGAGVTNSNNFAIDTVRPTVMDIVVPDNALAAGDSSLVTFTFSEAVTGFTLADLNTPNITLENLSTADGGVTWTATLTPDGDITDAANLITLDNTGVTSVASGNAGVGTTDSNNYAVDTARPTVSIVVADSAIGIGQTSLVTFTFSEAVTGFTNDDLLVGNGELSTVDSDDGVTWTATFTPDADVNAYSNIISLKNGGVLDLAGNANAGPTDSNVYKLDAARPTSTITLANSALVTGQSTTVTIKFSEAVTDFDNDDLTTIDGGSLSTVSTADGGVTWTATFTAGPTAGATNIISLNNADVTDLAGNAGMHTSESANYTISPYVPPVQPEPTTPTPTAGDDVITLPATGGTISAGEGADTVSGLQGDDIINGNVGDDSVSGGGGDDIVRGGQGSDFVQGNTGDDQIFGDIGQDTLHGGQGGDFVQGNVGDDYLSGDLGNDTILGGQGTDLLFGGAGDDYLSGDLGDDALKGGAGADLFNFAGGGGRDYVNDFSRAEGDHIRISLSDAADFASLSGHITSRGPDTLITLGAQTVVLVGVSASSLTAADFVFA